MIPTLTVHKLTVLYGLRNTCSDIYNLPVQMSLVYRHTLLEALLCFGKVIDI